jgi:hypothetical protein
MWSKIGSSHVLKVLLFVAFRQSRPLGVSGRAQHLSEEQIQRQMLDQITLRTIALEAHNAEAIVSSPQMRGASRQVAY